MGGDLGLGVSDRGPATSSRGRAPALGSAPRASSPRRGPAPRDLAPQISPFRRRSFLSPSLVFFFFVSPPFPLSLRFPHLPLQFSLSACFSSSLPPIFSLSSPFPAARRARRGSFPGGAIRLILPPHARATRIMDLMRLPTLDRGATRAESEMGGTPGPPNARAPRSARTAAEAGKRARPGISRSPRGAARECDSAVVGPSLRLGTGNVRRGQRTHRGRAMRAAVAVREKGGGPGRKKKKPATEEGQHTPPCAPFRRA